MDEPAPRDPGLYWIDGGDEPDIARWDGTQWWLHGSTEPQGEADVVVLRPEALSLA